MCNVSGMLRKWARVIHLDVKFMSILTLCLVLVYRLLYCRCRDVYLIDDKFILQHDIYISIITRI